MLTEKEEKELNHLRILQSDGTRFLSQDEFERIKFLSEKAFIGQAEKECEMHKEKGILNGEGFEHLELKDRSNWLLLFAIAIAIMLAFFNKTYGQTPGEVYDECVRLGIKSPEIVTKQSILETGNYECEKCSLDHNNIFGFQWKGEYLEYDTWQESVAYYAWWQNKHYKGQDYYDFLECIWKHRDGRCARYAEKPTYIDDLKLVKLDI